MDKFWHVTLRDGPERHWAQCELLDIFADKKNADELACGVRAYCFVKVGRCEVSNWDCNYKHCCTAFCGWVVNMMQVRDSL